MIKHTKNELRIFIHRSKKKNNRKREQKLVYRAMIFKKVKGMRKTQSQSVNPPEHIPL